MAGPVVSRTGQAFTLVEVLLVVVLLMLLAGAIVFNFSTLTQHTPLDEGATRLETLLRFARAHAANTGRRVQVSFDEDTGTNATALSSATGIRWEPDPLGQPGIFEPVPEGALRADTVLDQIKVESVALGDAPEEEMNPETQVASSAEFGLDDFFAAALPPMTFYPDGSSDSARIVLSSRDPDDLRRLRLTINGLSGAVRREFINEAGEPVLADEGPEAPAEGTPLAGKTAKPAEPARATP